MSDLEQPKRGRGRPRKEPVAYDAEVVKDFVQRFFEVQREMNVLKGDIAELKDEFKNKINQKLISKVIRLVKIKLALDAEDASPDTIEDIEDLVAEKVNMVV